MNKSDTLWMLLGRNRSLGGRQQLDGSSPQLRKQNPTTFHN
jgi:hypothetical protein